MERYGLLAAKLVNLGYNSLVIDWRGHGLSDRLMEDPKTCHVARFTDYQKDVAAMVEAAEQLGLPKPWHLVGSSMGACIGLRAVIEGLQVSTCAFIAPMWGINLTTVQRYAAWSLSWAAQTFGKGHIYAPGQNDQSYVLKAPFAENTMTHDQSMYRHLINQLETCADLQLGGPSMGWLFESLNECRNLAKLPSPQVPCVTFCGSQDQDVDMAAIERRMSSWPDGRLEVVKDAKHDILSERPEIREVVLKKLGELFQA